MSDKPPLIFEVRFGALHPCSTAAQEALRACTGRVRVEIKRTTANQRRRGFYWVMLDVAAQALTDQTGFFWDSKLLHTELKRRLELGETFTMPSGKKVFKPKSTSNVAMREPERADWTDRCAKFLSHEIGCEVEELMDEARRVNGGQ